ncbi:MAG TPA: 50S ribosomal protein L22 [Pyrinomonadaceae bacterium]|nr:50S ribosomal protein L22 [Pyrinomonadaceae bacterium]
MQAVAKLRHLKGSPRKARLVIDLIRGENVGRALSILKFTDKRAADPIAQCLNSAIANATYKAEQENIAIDPEDLWVKTCFVDMGAHKNRRRMRPAPQGRAYREQRHYCHITIEVTSDEKPKTEKEMKAEAAKARRADAPKKETKKASPKAAPKKAKAEETETPVAQAADPLVPTPVEPTAQAMNEAAEVVGQPVDETPTEVATVEAAKADAEASDAKDTSTQNPAELNESKPADEAMENQNEELERQ